MAIAMITGMVITTTNMIASTIIITTMMTARTTTITTEFEVVHPGRVAGLMAASSPGLPGSWN